jgi:hypothetical protein
MTGFSLMRRYLFADEAGDFAFARTQKASKYLIIGVISLDSCDCGAALLDLRRQLIWDRQPIRQYFHASEDKQPVRDAVFAFIQQVDFHFYATIMEKSKAQPQVRESNERFYQYGWYYLLKFVAPRVMRGVTELMVTAASIGTKKGQAVFTAGVNDVLAQTCRLPRDKWATAFHPAQTDPCLQIADYCIWALQRKWESGDTRSYDLISRKVDYEYDLWAHGSRHYY